MSTEINTRGLIRAKISGFPTGNDAECMTKAEILSTGMALVNGTYSDNECPMIDDVVGNVVTNRWEFYTAVGTLTWNINGDINEKSTLVTCNYQTLTNGVVTNSEKRNWSIKSYTNTGSWNVRKVGDYLYCSPRMIDAPSSVVTLQADGTTQTATLFLQQV